MVVKLLQELPLHVNVPATLKEKGRVLDNFYIPTRYPNGHPEGPLGEIVVRIRVNCTRKKGGLEVQDEQKGC